MKYEDLSFITKDENGEELINDITAVVPNINNSEEPYVVYTDYLLTKTNKFRILISELVEVEGDYILQDINDEEKIEEIKKTSLTLHSKAYKRLQEKYSNIN